MSSSIKEFMRAFNYLLKRTIDEVVLNIVFAIDFILPDLTIFSSLRTKIGKQTRIRRGQYLTNLKKLRIGNNCFVNRENIFDNQGMIIIGNNCSIGYRNQFLTTNHYERDKIKNIEFTTYAKEIRIGNNVWITSNCVITPGTIIEDNVILASGSVATGKLERNYLYGGVPARKLRETKGFVAKRR